MILREYDRTKIREGDRIIVSGFCTSEQKFIYNLRGVVGDVDEYEIKIWPEDGRLDGKIWFRRKWVRLIKHYGSTLFSTKEFV